MYILRWLLRKLPRLGSMKWTRRSTWFLLTWLLDNFTFWFVSESIFVLKRPSSSLSTMRFHQLRLQWDLCTRWVILSFHLSSFESVIGSLSLLNIEQKKKIPPSVPRSFHVESISIFFYFSLFRNIMKRTFSFTLPSLMRVSMDTRSRSRTTVPILLLSNVRLERVNHESSYHTHHLIQIQNFMER